MAVKLKDIADAVGVTTTTVSYVLNGKHSHTSEKTCNKIKTVAEKLGYLTDDIARTMVTGKSNVIGFIAMNPSWEFVAGILTGVMQRASEKNLFIKLLSYQNEISAAEIIKICRKQRLAGLICYNLSYEIIDALQKTLPAENIFLAVVSNALVPAGCAHVMANDEQGGYKAVEHLYSLGHRKIAHITGLNNMPYSIDRKNGYLKAMKDFGLPVHENYIFDPSLKNSEYIDATLTYIRQLVKRGADRPTAIFCVSDLYAITVITELQRQGIKVPENISVVGYADMYFGTFPSPKISTVREPYMEIGSKTVDMLLDQKEGRASENKKILIDIEFIQRESSAPVKTESE